MSLISKPVCVCVCQVTSFWIFAITHLRGKRSVYTDLKTGIPLRPHKLALFFLLFIYLFLGRFTPSHVTKQKLHWSECAEKTRLLLWTCRHFSSACPDLSLDLDWWRSPRCCFRWLLSSAPFPTLDVNSKYFANCFVYFNLRLFPHVPNWFINLQLFLFIYFFLSLYIFFYKTWLDCVCVCVCVCVHVPYVSLYVVTV